MKKLILLLCLIVSSTLSLSAGTTIFYYGNGYNPNSNLHAYFYNNELVSWPGVTMTTLGAQAAFYYSEKITPNSEQTVIFNNAQGGNGNQTVDISYFIDNTLYIANSSTNSNSNHYVDTATPVFVIRTSDNNKSDSGWSDKITMTSAGDGVFKSDAVNVDFNNATYGIKFSKSDNTSQEYGWINNSTNFTGSAITLAYGNSNGTITLSGTYIFKLDLKDMSFSAEKVAYDIYLAGRFNDWVRSSSDANKVLFTYNESDGTYTATVDDLANKTNSTKDEGFKLALREKGSTSTSDDDIIAWLGANSSNLSYTNSTLTLATVSGNVTVSDDVSAAKITLSNVSKSSATLKIEKVDLNNQFTLTVGGNAVTLTKSGSTYTGAISSISSSDKIILKRTSDAEILNTQYLSNSSAIVNGTKTQVTASLSEAASYIKRNIENATITLDYTNDRSAYLTISGTNVIPTPRLVGREGTSGSYNYYADFVKQSDGSYVIDAVDLTKYDQYKIADIDANKSVVYNTGVNIGGASGGNSKTITVGQAATSLSCAESDNPGAILFSAGSGTLCGSYKVTLTYDGADNATIKFEANKNSDGYYSGVVSGASNENSISLTQGSDAYTYSFSFSSVKANQTLSFTCLTADGNSYTLGSSTAISDLTAGEKTISLTSGADAVTFDNKYSNVSGTITFAKDYKTATLVVSGEKYTTEVYLLGSQNNWIAASEYKFVRAVDNATTYTLTYNGTLSGTFKIGDAILGQEADWNINLGGTNGQVVTYGTTDLTGSENLTFGDNIKDVILTLKYVKDGTSTLTIKPINLTHQFYLNYGANDSNVDSSDTELVLADGHTHTYTVTLEELAANTSFNIIRQSNDNSKAYYGTYKEYDLINVLSVGETTSPLKVDGTKISTSEKLKNVVITLKYYSDDNIKLTVKADDANDDLYIVGADSEWGSWGDPLEANKFKYLGNNQYVLENRTITCQFRVSNSDKSKWYGQNGTVTNNDYTYGINKDNTYAIHSGSDQNLNLKPYGDGSLTNVDIFVTHKAGSTDCEIIAVAHGSYDGENESDVEKPLVFMAYASESWDTPSAHIWRDGPVPLYLMHSIHESMTGIYNNTDNSIPQLYAYNFKPKTNLSYSGVKFYRNDKYDGGTHSITSFETGDQTFTDGNIYILNGDNAVQSTVTAHIVMHSGVTGFGETWGDGIEFTYAGNSKFVAKNVRLNVDYNFGFKVGYYSGGTFQQLGWLTGSSTSFSESELKDGIQLSAPIMGSDDDNNGTIILNGTYNLTIDMTDLSNIRLYGEQITESDDDTSDIDIRAVSSHYGWAPTGVDIQIAVEVIDKATGKLASTRYDKYKYDFLVAYNGSAVEILDQLGNKVTGKVSSAMPFVQWNAGNAGEYTVYIRVTDTETNQVLYYSSEIVTVKDVKNSSNAKAKAESTSTSTKKSGCVYFENTANWATVRAALGISSSTAYTGVKDATTQSYTLTPEADGRYKVTYYINGINYNRIIFFNGSTDVSTESSYKNFYDQSEYSTGKINLEDNAVYNAEGTKLADIYFDNSEQNWSEPCAYMYNEASTSSEDGTIRNADWPGVSGTLTTDNIYRFTYNATAGFDRLIFSDNKANQLDKIEGITAGALYKGTTMTNATYANDLITDEISFGDEINEDDKFYIRSLYYTCTARVGNGDIRIDGQSNILNGVEKNVTYAWAKFENFTNKDKSANYNTGDNGTNNWTREKSADNARVAAETSDKLTNIVCFNPSFYRVYMFVSRDKSNSPKKSPAKDDQTTETTTDSEDHGAQGEDIGYGAEAVVSWTTTVINFEGATTGIADIIFGPAEGDDSDAPVEYYNLNGIKMSNTDNLTPGIYIMRRGQKAVKILIK